MNDPALLENIYKGYVTELESWPTDATVVVDIQLLLDLNLIDMEGRPVEDVNFKRSFCFIESDDKITLINEKFVIWIVPRNIDEFAATFTLVARNSDNAPTLELLVITEGIFNTSQLVLKVLDRLLDQIDENEELLQAFSTRSKT